MKFLCDRCKTRYSIGDERVRGKILKIRCKNCANVITVREGAGDPDAPAAEAPRVRRPSTGAPPVGNALGAAFAKQMTKPPPALEEEWYVSIEGQQSGPFSLTEAQRWVANKPFDADLHCWSEGFDDWLPVDKVSHFRGLRKPRIKQATTPPPIPRPATTAPRGGSGRIPALAATAPAPAPAEPEPKPLFAATMAALERDSGAHEVPARANGSGTLAALAAVAPAPAAAPRAIQAKANVTGPMPRLPGPGTVPAIGKVAPLGGMSAGAKALAEAFDVDDPSDSATSVGAPAFPDEPESAAPLPAKKIEGEDDMEIGEVSRVVKLADLAKMGGPRPARTPKNTGRATGAVARLPANELGVGVGSFGATGPFQPINMPLPGALGEPVPSESVVAAALPREHRRGMMILLGASALVLAGGVVALVLLLGNDDSETSTTLGHAMQYDNDRPDDVALPRPRNAIEAVQQQAALNAPRPVKRPVQQITKQVEQPETPGDLTKSKIKPEEIEDIANKNSEGTKRCYLRAQKGALGIDIADLKRIDVLFAVDTTGNVTNVTLSDHTNDQFGQCLIGRIKAWKFRTSPGGQFKIPLVFGS